MNRKLTRAELDFISQNMKLSGFSGIITRETANYRPDLKAIAESAGRLGAQIPASIQKCSPQLERKKKALRLAMSRWLQRVKPQEKARGKPTQITGRKKKKP